jgi:hypothetical protein
MFQHEMDNTVFSDFHGVFVFPHLENIEKTWTMMITRLKHTIKTHKIKNGKLSHELSSIDGHLHYYAGNRSSNPGHPI